MPPKLVSMKMTKAEIKERNAPMADAPDSPRYPYGLTIRLDNDSLDKLGEDTLPAVGESVMVLAKATVSSMSSNESADGGAYRSLELQITDLCLEADDDVVKKAVGKLYKG